MKMLGSNHKKITTFTKYDNKNKNNFTPNLRGKPKLGKTTGRLEPENISLCREGVQT